MNLYEIITNLQDPELSQELDSYVMNNLSDFKRVLANHPLQTPSPGCISVSEAFWLFSLVKAIEPDIIIESGTLEGYSLYFLSQAAPLQAQIFSFDPHSDPKFNDPKITYRSCDWASGDLPSFKVKKGLIFFDDHLHHGRRLKQALRSGIQHVVFHDNYVTSIQSHIPIRFCNLTGIADRCYTFDRLTCDSIFLDTTQNPQNYRWLTYVRVDTQSNLIRRGWRRLRLRIHTRNPYSVK